MRICYKCGTNSDYLERRPWLLRRKERPAEAAANHLHAKTGQRRWRLKRRANITKTIRRMPTIASVKHSATKTRTLPHERQERRLIVPVQHVPATTHNKNRLCNRMTAHMCNHDSCPMTCSSLAFCTPCSTRTTAAVPSPATSNVLYDE